MWEGVSADEMYWTTPPQKTGDSRVGVGRLRMQAAPRVALSARLDKSAPPNQLRRPLRSGNDGGRRASIANTVTPATALTPSFRRSAAARGSEDRRDAKW